MIKVKLTKEGNQIKKIKISGHAGYAEAGKDIVCAAVSSSVILTINNILTIDNEALTYDNRADLEINILKDDKIINILINNLVNSLSELEADYQEFIKIESED